jgi:hypothetical protein
MLYKVVFNWDNLNAYQKDIKTTQIQKDCFLNSIDVSRLSSTGDVYFNVFINNEKVFTDDINFKNIFFIMPLLLHNQRINKNDIVSVVIHSNLNINEKIQVILNFI